MTRASYRDIALYAPDRTPCAIDLSDNTNLWGMPPAALLAVVSSDNCRVTRYPELYSAGLKRALSTYVGAPVERLATGCGSDDVLDSAIRAFADPGDRLAFPDPTFPMVPVFARMNGLEPIAVPMTPSYDVDAARLLETGARIIYLCSPNNPTGGSLSRASIEAVVRGARQDQIVIVDEAYAEFANASVLDLAGDGARLVVTRTMSKAFGLAGLRVGYAVGAPALIAEIEKSRGPYKVNAVAEQAAIAALGAGLDWSRSHADLAIANRQRFELQLLRRGLLSAPSAANFVFLPIAGAPAIARAMRTLGVAVRPFDGLPPISAALASSKGAALRFTIGPWEKMTEALIAFDRSRTCV